MTLEWTTTTVRLGDLQPWPRLWYNTGVVNPISDRRNASNVRRSDTGKRLPMHPNHITTIPHTPKLGTA